MSIKNKTNNNNTALFGAEATVEEEYTNEYLEMTRVTLNELNPGDMVTGSPVIHLFENNEPDKKGKPKNYDNIRVRIVDKEADEYVDAYVNIPKTRQNIRKNTDFYRSCFDFIHSTLCTIDDTNATNQNGEPVNTYKKINIDALIAYINEKEEITIKITEGSNGYNSFLITGWK